MKNTKNIIRKLILLGAVVLFVLGCEDIIEVDLNSAEPTIVIDGSIVGDSSKSLVTITKSTDFYQPGIYKKISGAQVLMDDSEGNSVSFIEISDGVYESRTIIGRSNVEYSIHVIADGESYDAISTMPNKITLDSLSLEEAPSRPGKGEDSFGFIVHMYFQDQLGVDDYCRFKLYNNGVQLGGFNIYEDRLTDGNYIDFRLILNSDEVDIALGDELTVELMSIDKAAFDYYKTAGSVNASGSTHGGPNSTSAAPSNPVTNWSNKALGFFTAYTTTKQSIILEL